MRRVRLAGPGVSLHLLPGPHALAGRPEEIAAAAGCVIMLAVIFVGDVLTPIQVVIGALGLIPLLAACWLFSDRLAASVAIVAVGQLLLTAVLGELEVVTLAAETMAYVVLGLFVWLYARNLAELLSNTASRRQFGPMRRLNSDKLTKRETEVAELAARGYTAREISALLHISERTVETHVANLRSKLGIRAKAHLVREITKLGLPTGSKDGAN